VKLQAIKNLRRRNILYIVVGLAVAAEATRAFATSNVPVSAEPVIAGAGVTGMCFAGAVHYFRRNSRRWPARA
jgi:hypothetical protein